jgi:hypothetical protein
LFTGKIRTCGCFGDCIPLTPIQTFTKDIMLLVLVLILLFGQKFIFPLFKPRLSFSIVLLSLVATLLLQRYVLRHSPLIDCLPFKKGNNILELRKMPAGAVPDKYSYSFVYEKNGEKKEFTSDKLPDSTWKFADRKQTLIEKGKNNVPAINDFSLVSMDGIDSTEIIMAQPSYYLFFLKEISKAEPDWIFHFEKLAESAKEHGKPLYVIASNAQAANEFFNKFHMFAVPVLTCDVTAIKTAARVDPTVYDMKGPVVQGKYSWADLDKFLSY